MLLPVISNLTREAATKYRPARSRFLVKTEVIHWAVGWRDTVLSAWVYGKQFPDDEMSRDQGKGPVHRDAL